MPMHLHRPAHLHAVRYYPDSGTGDWAQQLTCGVHFQSQLELIVTSLATKGMLLDPAERLGGQVEQIGT